MNKGMFERVSAMNVAFCNPKGDPNNINWERLENQCKNIQDEFNELMSAIALRDVSGGQGVRDALCDILVFTLGAQHFMGIDGNTDMNAVLDGVMSRFVKNQEDHHDTMTKYNNLGVEYYSEGSYPTMCLKSSRHQWDINGENYPKGKFLKSASFANPVFPPLVDK